MTRVVTVAAAQMGPVGGKGSCEQALARRMFGRLEEDWLLVAGRGFYNWPDWQAAAATGAALLWRVKADRGCRCSSCCPTVPACRSWPGPPCTTRPGPT